MLLSIGKTIATNPDNQEGELMNEEPYIELPAEDAAPLVASGELKVIDVRQPYEWAGGHIAGATLIPLDGLYSFALNLARQGLPKDQPLLFVCAAGQRSASASEIAAIAGYTRVYNLVGGMGSWAYEGLPAVRD